VTGERNGLRVSRRVWIATAFVYTIILFFTFGRDWQLATANLEQYQSLALLLMGLLLVIPPAVILVLRRNGRLGLTLSVTLLAELVFFFMVPVIPMVNTSTYDGPPGGSCCVFLTYASLPYIYSCFGTTMELWTTVNGGYALENYGWGQCLSVPLGTG
jgi:hypothetical protein